MPRVLSGKDHPVLADRFACGASLVEVAGVYHILAANVLCQTIKACDGASLAALIGLWLGTNELFCAGSPSATLQGVPQALQQCFDETQAACAVVYHHVPCVPADSGICSSIVDEWVLRGVHQCCLHLVLLVKGAATVLSIVFAFCLPAAIVNLQQAQSGPAGAGDCRIHTDIHHCNLLSPSLGDQL